MATVSARIGRAMLRKERSQEPIRTSAAKAPTAVPICSLDLI